MSEHEPIDWDELDAETQHELVSLAEKLGDESGQGGGRTASRREFLGAITAAGLGGSLLSEGADRAFEDFVSPVSAGTQSVAQFGEAGEPFDFVAEDIYGPGGQGSGDPVNFESVKANTATIGTGNDFSGIPPRDLVNNTDTTVNVNSGDSVQEALNQVPILLRQPYTIKIDETAGDFGEDLIIPPVISASMNSSTSSDNPQLQLTRQGSSGRWETDSIYAAGGFGVGPTVRIDSCTVTNENPYDNESAAIGLYGGHVDIKGVKFDPETSIENGVMYYGAKGNITGRTGEEVDFTAGNVTNAFYTKSEAGSVVVNGDDQASVIGSVTNIVKAVSGTRVALRYDFNLSGGYDLGLSGWVIQEWDNAVVGLDGPYAVTKRSTETVQEAINRADSEGVLTVKVPAGQYNESLTIPSEGMVIKGSAKSGTFQQRTEIDARGLSGSPVAVDFNGKEGVRVEGFRLRSDNSTVVTADSLASDVIACLVGGDIDVNAARVTIARNRLNGNNVNLLSNSDGCVVSLNTNLGGGGSRSGTGNVISNNS